MGSLIKGYHGGEEMLQFFGKKQQRQITAQTSNRQSRSEAVGDGTEYSPGLVDALVSEHRTLLELHGEIKTAFDKADYATVSARLEKYHELLQNHLQTENTHLYRYLERQFANDYINVDLIRGFRQEMDNIAREATQVLTKYTTIGVEPSVAEAFQCDFEKVGQVLAERIAREEGVLYPLYLPRY
jgi:hypothetical protein